MDTILSVLSAAEIPAALLLLVTGGIFTVMTRAVLLRRFPTVLKRTLTPKRGSERGTLSSFEAFSCSLAGTLGIGNLVGVAQALRVGGAGAVLWIWIGAALSGTVKSAEILLALRYRDTGPLGYLKKAFRSPLPARLYRVLFLAVTFLMGDMAQSSAVTDALGTSDTPLLHGASLLLTAVVGIFLIIPKDRTARLTARITPVMTVLYLLLGLTVIAVNVKNLPEAAASVFRDAFSFRAVSGGFGGWMFLQAMRSGIMNGLFSHEAGLGSSAFAHAKTSEDPVRESLFGVTEVFFDSVVVSGITAFCLLTSGKATVADAFGGVFGPFGNAVTVFITFLFAVSSVICWSYYGRSCVEKKYETPFSVLFLTLCYVGAVLRPSGIWEVSSFVNALAMAVNLIALLRLRKEVRIVIPRDHDR